MYLMILYIVFIGVFDFDFYERRGDMIDLYYWFMFNGKKVIILLEEVGVFYNIVLMNILMGD